MGGYTGFSRFQKYNYFYVILVKKMDKDGAKYVGYAQNAVNCGVECVYFATHTTHILKDLDFAFPSFAASIFCSNSKNYRLFSFYY